MTVSVDAGNPAAPTTLGALSRRSLLCCFTVFLLAASTSRAEVKSFGDGPVDREERKATAKKFGDLYAKLAGAIPKLSRAEEQYVASEYRDALAVSGGVYSPRLLRLIGSKEYNIREARHWAREIATHANFIPSTTDVAREVLHWSQMASLMIDRDGAWSVYQLKDFKILEDKDLPISVRGASVELFLANLVLDAEIILKNVVTPYLEGRLP
jgi:hypothetical protein